jgi:diguanylate cyclase
MGEVGISGTAAKRLAHARFASRIYKMRALGLGTGCIAVGGVLYGNGASWPWWVALVANGTVWPSFAYWSARRSADPRRAEYRNLTIDSAAGGVWIAAMQFNLMPSLLLAVMLSADKIGVGGWRFLPRTAIAQALTCAVTWSLLGFPFQPQTTLVEMLWCIPFVLAYPLALSTLTHALGREVVRQNRMLERSNRTDGLTGLPNRRHWEEAVAAECARSERSGSPAALLMLDVDLFKQVNDRYGHPVGDRVLQQVALIVQTVVREVDTPGRFGGDEFGVLLADAAMGDAEQVAERIRAAVATLRLADLPDLTLSVSIGVAAKPRFASAGEWIRQADLALYAAKREGRNRVASSARDPDAEGD